MTTPTPAALKHLRAPKVKITPAPDSSKTSSVQSKTAKSGSSRVSSATTENARPNRSTTTTSSSTPTEESSTSAKTVTTQSAKPVPKKPFTRTDHLTQKPLADHPGLEKLQEELKGMEQINKDAGWYDRDRNGKKPLPKNTKPNPPSERARKMRLGKAVNFLKELVGENNLIDVGRNAEKHLGISGVEKTMVIKALEAEGYKRFYIPVKHKDGNLNSSIAVLTAPGTTFKQVMDRKDEIFIADKAKSKSVVNGRRTQAEAKYVSREEKRTKVVAMKAAGYSNVAIGKALGINESSVRSLLAPVVKKENN